ncbi:MAG: ABC transporter permease [Steroidobacteraceae bacterium]
MKYLPLVWAGLSRRWGRTLFTFFSIVVAFLLFGLLHGVSVGFDSLVNSMSDQRVRVQDRVSFTRWIPLAMRDQIERIPGVTAVAPVAYFGGYYQNPENQVGAYAVGIAAFFKLYPELELPASEKQAMLEDRTGVLVGADLAKRYGLKVGESLAIATPIWTHKDGSKAWNFKIAGIYRFKHDTPPANKVIMHYDYINQARSELTNMASQYIVGVAQAGSAERISRQIDALFQNSSAPTLAQPEKDWVRGQILRVGNIEFMVNAILGAVLPLKDLMRSLDPREFAQIHRSTIVRLAAVERVQRDVFGRCRAHLKDHSDVLTVRRTYLDRFKQM